mgnify:CR=1 FL=1
MKKYIKFANHLCRLRSGNTFFTLGYPRSGTTMLSELISMLTFYNFDRNNVFYNSAPRILHTHWLREVDHQRSIYIIRNPREVALSVRRFADVRGLSVNIGEDLQSKTICSASWINHVDYFRLRGYLLVDYTCLLNDDAYTVGLIASHLNVPESFVLECLRVMRSRHSYVVDRVDENLYRLKSSAPEAYSKFNIKLEEKFYEKFLDEYRNK